MYNKDEILKRMLDRVPKDMDKRQGSIIFDTQAPVSIEIAKLHEQSDENLKEGFADSASIEYLCKRALEFGMEPYGAVNGVMRGELIGGNIPLGARFSLKDTLLKYKVLAHNTSNLYDLECETAGSIGSAHLGQLIPIDYIAGLTSARLVDVVKSGQDPESVDNFRKRFLISRRKPATSGNKYHYEQWALEIPGVGNVKCIPIWNGAGTVKVIIVDTNDMPASSDLCSTVFDYIEGVRPIGADLTVVPATALRITVSASIALNASITLDNVKTELLSKIKAYYSSVIFNRQQVSAGIIGGLLLDIDGVLDYSSLTLNGITANIPLGDEEIPVTEVANIVLTEV